MTDKNRHFSRLLSSFPSLPPFLPPSLSSLPQSLFFNPFHSSLPFFLRFLPPSFPPPSFPSSPNCPFSLTVALPLFRKTLFEDCPGFFNSENGVLEAPLVIQVADQVSLRSMFSCQVEFTVCFFELRVLESIYLLQTRPVCFSVCAIVTPGDIAFNVKEINFGYCTTVESVRQTITITNKSILPQIYGFCGVPEVRF